MKIRKREKIEFKRVSIKEAQLIKRGLLLFNLSNADAPEREKRTARLMIEKIDQAVDETYRSKKRNAKSPPANNQFVDGKPLTMAQYPEPNTEFYPLTTHLTNL